MAKMTRKCQYCGLDDTHVDEMEFEYVGKKKPQKKYYHKHCWEKHLKEKEFREKERKELDRLVETIKNIYGLKKFPNNIYPYLQDLRNGTEFFGKHDYKYKEGYSYDLITEAFEYCSETIENANRKKSFSGATNAIRYGLTIVCNKLSIVEERRRQKEEQERQIRKHVENISEEEYIFENSYKKPSKHTDITDFLDD
ncbi:hypothetical protein MOD25_05735 [Bacillus haynesii]|uniref:hypothetical protein n=1 Tax=Bacillus haynesii TaxID=1925021 RepID=UPI00227DDFC4|nr:hypothetical protein [Bacillus haynesii]MCY8549403.1 hypothetical protein [Bacillus haynesii]